jgi:hypothetical protein
VGGCPPRSVLTFADEDVCDGRPPGGSPHAARTEGSSGGGGTKALGENASVREMPRALRSAIHACHAKSSLRADSEMATAAGWRSLRSTVIA